MRKHFTRWLLGWLMMMLMLVGSVTALADNKDVMDQAGVLSPKTQQEIKNLNQHQLSSVKTKPQLAVVTVKSLKGQDIDDVAQSYFDKYRFGRKGYDNGVLLLIAVKDHQVRMQTGYGVEGALPDLYIKKLMTPSVKDQLRNQDYDSAVMAMSQQIVGRLEKQEGKIRTQTKAQAEAEVKAKYDKKVNQLIDFIGYVLAIGLAIGACVYFGCKLGMRKDRMKKAYLDKRAKEEDDDSTPIKVDARQYVSRDHVYHDDDYDRDRYDRDRYDRDDDDGMGDFVRGAVTGAIVDHMLHDYHDEEEHHHYDDDDGDYLSHDSNDDWSSSNDDSGWDSNDDSSWDSGSDWGSSDDSSWDSGSDWGSDDDFGGFGGDSGGGGGDDSW